MTFKHSLLDNSYLLQGNLYQGTIVDTNDPQRKNRVKVKIDNLTDQLDKELLPFYIVFHSAGQGNNSVSNVPTIGSRVIVNFPNNDIYNGIVYCILQQKLDS